MTKASRLVPRPPSVGPALHLAEHLAERGVAWLPFDIVAERWSQDDLDDAFNPVGFNITGILDRSTLPGGSL